MNGLHIRREQLILIVLLICLLLSCGGEAKSRVKNKLDVILRDDLEAITADISPQGLADSLFYHIDEFDFYKEGKYSYRAVVEFHIFKKTKAYILRKYRYHKDARLWERYYNKYHFDFDSLSSEN